MNSWLSLRSAVLTLTVLSLVFGTFAVPLAAAPVVHETASAMADNMPCPTEEQKFDFGCARACPLMTICMSACFPGVTSCSPDAIATWAESDVIFPAIYRDADNLSAEPPPRPPKA